MATAVRLTVLTGPHKNRRFCFCGPMRCQVGRDSDCFIQLCGSERDLLISRYHCLLDIEPNLDPPSLRIWDLGSKNGTFINARQVPWRPDQASACTGSVVNPGDLLTIGGTTLSVDLIDCPHGGSKSARPPGWESGALAKKDCTLHC
jgi:pSer/pThr/pTyr-binding forkhead associated (FHA) protein